MKVGKATGRRWWMGAHLDFVTHSVDHGGIDGMWWRRDKPPSQATYDTKSIRLRNASVGAHEKGVSAINQTTEVVALFRDSWTLMNGNGIDTGNSGDDTSLQPPLVYHSLYNKKL